MNRTIVHGERYGIMKVPSSKSKAHRALICAALSKESSDISCSGVSQDIAATISCLNALGAAISLKESDIIRVNPIRSGRTDIPVLMCGESGSTLRFLLPVVGALGKEAVFHMDGRLSERPVDDLIRACEEGGMKIEKRGNRLYVSGTLQGGTYEISGNISSQFISGLLFALPLLKRDSILKITGKIESSQYIKMTEDAVIRSGISFEHDENEYRIPGNQIYKAGTETEVEKDWSNAAFPLCMGAFSEKGISVEGLNINSDQGDKKIIEIISDFGAQVSFSGDTVTVRKGTLKGLDIEASEIPDLVPVISVVASVAEGITRIKGAGRLRLKESDRIESTALMINSLGGYAEVLGDSLIITGRPFLTGGTVDSFKDHRIAMSAVTAACVSNRDVTVTKSMCTEKSFHGFYDEFDKLEVKK